MKYTVFTKLIVLLSLVIAADLDSSAQQTTFSRADTLRGSLRPERTCYDVHYYDLDIEIVPEQKEIVGRVDIYFDLLQESNRIQVDLFRNMEISAIRWRGKKRKFKREFDAVFIDVEGIPVGKQMLSIYYNGQPRTGKMLPWDGGFIWTTDQEGNPWIAVACEGIGASLWWPNKDHLSDEPDSLRISCTVPQPLQCISNGSPERVLMEPGGLSTWTWKVNYPINNYNVSINIGKYTHFSDTFRYNNGLDLALDYYVMPYNLEKAREHFEQVKKVLKAFEHYLGPYPYPIDGYALVETPYLGMEHQGAIAYGNRFQRGYLGGMQPRDMDQDYIILHETGHEYFGNWISCSDHAEMWIHESFTTYLESLYVEYFMGKKAALRYLNYQRPFIRNSAPLVGPMGVNYQGWGSSDIYYKGSWLLQTLREYVHHDEKWFGMLKGLVADLGNKVVTSEEVCSYIEDNLELSLSHFYAQYLHEKSIPVLSWKESEGQVLLRWESTVDNFEMPLVFRDVDGEDIVFSVTKNWQRLPGKVTWDRSTIEDIRSRYLADIIKWKEQN